MLSSSLLVVHDTSRGSQDDVTELSGGQQVVSPSLNVGDLDVESGRDNSTLVQSTVQLNDNLTRTVVINVLELTNVTMSLHDSQEFDDDLGRRSNHDLALTGLLGIVDGVQGIG